MRVERRQRERKQRSPALTQRIDEIAAAAGVIEVQIVHHAGHASKHARGASALPSWADAIWTYERDEDGDRYISAEGRYGVGLAPGLVTVDDDGRLTYSDAGPRQTAAEKPRRRRRRSGGRA